MVVVRCAAGRGEGEIVDRAVPASTPEAGLVSGRAGLHLQDENALHLLLPQRLGRRDGDAQNWPHYLAVLQDLVHQPLDSVYGDRKTHP